MQYTMCPLSFATRSTLRCHFCSIINYSAFLSIRIEGEGEVPLISMERLGIWRRQGVLRLEASDLPR
jgi:hypothetical protein